MASHNELGARGEEVAAGFLAEKEFRHLERNWRFGKDEVDIISRHRDFLVFVEVKTRNTAFFGSPAQFVSKAKQRNLIRAAQAFVDQKAIDLEVRFDVVGIVIDKRGVQIEHLEGAFGPTW